MYFQDTKVTLVISPTRQVAELEPEYDGNPEMRPSKLACW